MATLFPQDIALLPSDPPPPSPILPAALIWVDQFPSTRKILNSIPN